MTQQLERQAIGCGEDLTQSTQAAPQPFSASDVMCPECGKPAKRIWWVRHGDREIHLFTCNNIHHCALAREQRNFVRSPGAPGLEERICPVCGLPYLLFLPSKDDGMYVHGAALDPFTPLLLTFPEYCLRNPSGDRRVGG